MMGLLAIVPVSVVLGITFLVFVGISKTEKGTLRTFGVGVAVLLVISTILMASMVSHKASKGGRYHMKKMMRMKKACGLLK